MNANLKSIAIPITRHPISQVSVGALIGILCYGFAVNSRAQTASYQRLHSFGFTSLSTGAKPLGRAIEGSDGALYGTAYEGGTHNLGTLFQLKKDGTYTILHNFSGAGGQDGNEPQAELLEGSDHLLYGTTSYGGTNGGGTIFRISKDGTGYTVLRHLSQNDGTFPMGGLVEGREDGVLYGTACLGGPISYGAGTVFKLNKDGSGFAVIHSFSENTASQPLAGLIEGADGELYGTTYTGGSYTNGTVFKIQRSGAGYSVLLHFQGTNGYGGSPCGPLIQGADGALYGTTKYGGNPDQIFGRQGNGTVFKLNTDGSGYQQLHLFAADGGEGRFPIAGLAQGPDGILYGVASLGGTNEAGTVFALTTNGAGFSVVHHPGAVTDGGSSPQGVVLSADGALYVTTFTGGRDQMGVIFRTSANGTISSILHHFVNAAGGDGTGPGSVLTAGGSGVLYGTTCAGGLNNNGTVFRINEDGSGYSTIHAFAPDGVEGTTPNTGVIKGSDGVLYGTTSRGGTNWFGTVFRLNPDGTGFKVLHHFRFDVTDGASPFGELLEGNDGLLYGTTYEGGANGNGTVFRLAKDGSSYTILHGLGNIYEDGGNPCGSLLQLCDGRLYGMTQNGGRNYTGVIFTIDTNGASYIVLHHFAGDPDPVRPYAGLMQGSDGMLYGTTANGGTNDWGTVFRVSTNDTDFKVLHDFSSSSSSEGGQGPSAKLVQDTDGTLYGTTTIGGSGWGTIFKLNADGSGFQTLYRFSGGTDGCYVPAGLVKDSDGALYGTTAQGGDMDYGVLFKLSLAPQSVTITGIQLSPAGARLSISGVPNQIYYLQGTTNLASTNGWQVLGSISTDNTGFAQFVDPNSSYCSTRYYRTSIH